MIAQAVLVQDVLDGDRRNPFTIQGQHGLDPVAAIGRMFQGQVLDPRHRFRRDGLGVALVDRRQVL